MSYLAEVLFRVLDLVQEVRVAGKGHALDILAVHNEGVQAHKRFILGNQVGVFDHLLHYRPIHIEWILWITIHFIFLLHRLVAFVSKELLGDNFVGVASDLPFCVEALIF